MKSTIIELSGAALIVAGLIAIDPALLLVMSGALLAAFGYSTSGVE